MPVKQRDSESSQEEGDDGKHEDNQTRQDVYVVFTHERELRNVDQIRIKISQFTGVVVTKCKNFTQQTMDNLLQAIEADALNFQKIQAANAQAPGKAKIKPQVQQQEMGGLSETAPLAFQTPTSGIVNLRFEECIIASKAVQSLKQFFSTKQLIETFVIQKVEFQEPIFDFRQMLEGLQSSMKIRKVGIIGMNFDEEPFGKILSHLLNDCRQLREFDCSQCEFFHPKCFFDMCQALINDKCRLNVLKLKNIHITSLEGKVLQFVLMKNKSLHTLDISNAKVDTGECLEFFLQKFDKHSNIKYLVLDNIQPELNTSLEILGEALSENISLTHLIMRDNKLKWVPYSNFWENIKMNTSLTKINISKTDLSDRVLEKLCIYLTNPLVKVQDLDLSRNQITDVGLQCLSDALISNKSIKYLNLSQNLIRDVGLKPLVSYLSQPSCCLQELSLMGNKINNEGIHNLAEFIKPNQSLKMLDISKNLYSDTSFSVFAAEMGEHATLTFLDISKSKELNDEGSLITLARQLAFNTYLQTLDLTGVRVRKPFLKLYMEPSLKKNITLKYVLGKLTPDIIDEQLHINIQIQTDVEPNFQQQVAKLQKNQFDVLLVDPNCNSLLNMKDQPNNLFDATFKFMQQRDVRQVDLSNMDLQDGQLYQLAAYLYSVPSLCSLILNGNKQITDDGISRIANSLSRNNKLAHLSFQNCRHLGNESLSQLLKVITEDNMMLCSIEMNESQCDFELVKKIKKETQLNRAIQEYLKPQFFSKEKSLTKMRPVSAETAQDSTGGVQNRLHESAPLSEEVFFQEGASVNKYLSSAIKCWRIAKPIIIQIENQQLTDKHVFELCEFLRGSNFVQNLNLRRNRITNIGATCIIDWIINHDSVLTHLDVSRNRITKAGAEAFLNALKSITRIVEFQIAYGNPIPLDISLAINQEIVANNQIKANQSDNRIKITPNSKVTLTNSKYELIDRGPNYMRCAIKSVELLKITHLSLPDNMLGLEESKMLAAMIKMNPPLKILNLEQNNLDAQCGKLIADALESNSNLQILNISKNKLSDLGINYLLQSLIKSRLAVLMDEKILKQQQQEQQELEAQKKEKEQQQIVEQTVTPASTTNNNNNNVQQSVQGRNLKAGQRGNNVEKRLSIKIPANQRQLNVSNTSNTPVNLKSRTTVKNISSPTMGEQVKEIQIQEPVKVSQILNTEEIEKCETGQLKVLNISENMFTVESYKSIWTLITINPSVVLYFDSPVQIQAQQKQQIILQQQSVRYQKIQSQRSQRSLEDTQSNLFKSQQSSRANFEDEYLMSNDDEENQLRAEMEIIVKKSNGCQKMHQENMFKIKKFCKLLCCFKQVNRKEEPTLSAIVFWRLKQSKLKAIEFKANPQAMTQFNRASVQNTISIILTANQFCLYVFSILPFFIIQSNVAIILALFLVYISLFEIILVLIARDTVKLQFFNLYLWLQLLSGVLKKAGLLSLGLIGGICAQSLTLLGIVIGTLTLLSIVVDQQNIIIKGKKLKQIDNSTVLPYIERSQKIAQLLDYQALLIAFQKITLLPSKNSELLSQRIALDLNPDLVKPPAVGIVAKIIESIQTNYKNNNIARHLVFIDVVLFFAIVIDLACGWSKLDIVIVVLIIILVLDCFSCFAQLSESDNDISLNQNEIFTLSSKRNLELADRYLEVLNREKEVTKIEEAALAITEGSLFETNDQIIEFVTNTIGGDEAKNLAQLNQKGQEIEEKVRNQKILENSMTIIPSAQNDETINLD